MSEQLPSIQPPPAHSASNSLLDQSHLMVEHENHNFIGMTSDFDAREQVVMSDKVKINIVSMQFCLWKCF